MMVDDWDWEARPLLNKQNVFTCHHLVITLFVLGCNFCWFGKQRPRQLTHNQRSFNGAVDGFRQFKNRPTTWFPELDLRSEHP